VDLIRNSKSEYIHRLAASILVKIAPNNPNTITALVDLIHNYQDEYTRWKVVSILVKKHQITPLLSLH
jgi:hypothetical protein